MANYVLEAALNADGSNIIAGVDEVGRGPWAGPVTVCAVILDPDNIPEGLNDSKKLTAKRRDVLFDLIMGSAEVSLVHVEVEEIDQINILQATFRGMERAVAGLPSVDHILIDGNKTPPNLNAPATAVVKGDGKSVSIAAASIIAKVTPRSINVGFVQIIPGVRLGNKCGLWYKNTSVGTAKSWGDPTP